MDALAARGSEKLAPLSILFVSLEARVNFEREEMPVGERKKMGEIELERLFRPQL
jgi:hypothetical protein